MFFLATALAAMQLFRQRYSQLSSIVSDAAGKRQRKRCDPVAASSAASDAGGCADRCAGSCFHLRIFRIFFAFLPCADSSVVQIAVPCRQQCCAAGRDMQRSQLCCIQLCDQLRFEL